MTINMYQQNKTKGIFKENMALTEDFVRSHFILQFFSVALVHFSDTKLLVHPPHHLITCAHHKSSLSFF